MLLSYLASTTLDAAARSRSDSDNSKYTRARTYSSASSQACSPRADESNDEIKPTISLRDGNTPLHTACTQDAATAIAIATTTLPQNIDARNYRRQTALMLACKHKLGMPIILCLIDKGAAPDTVDIHMSTVLHYACQGENIHIIKFLLETCGVPINASFTLGRPEDATEDLAIKNLIKHHREIRERKHREKYDDAQYHEIGAEDLAGMPILREEEDYELVDLTASP